MTRDELIALAEKCGGVPRGRAGPTSASALVMPLEAIQAFAAALTSATPAERHRMTRDEFDALAGKHVAGRDDHGQVIFTAQGWEAFAATLTSATPAGEGLTDEQIEDCIDAAHRKFNNYCSSGPRGQTITTRDDWKHWLAREVIAALAASPVPMAQLTNEEHKVLRSAVWDSAEVVHAGKADEPECERLSGHDWVKAAGGPTQCAKCGLTKADERGSAEPELHPIFAFLDGSAAFEGVWYGDTHPTRKGAFWWRSVLREALATTHSAPVAGLTLTGAEIDAIAHKALHQPGDVVPYWDNWCQEIGRPFARAIEAALREKAGGAA